MRYLIFYLILFSCTKSDSTTNQTNSGSTGNTGGTLKTTGALIMNINWGAPTATLVCPYPVFVSVDITGGNIAFNKTINERQSRIDLTLNAGTYAYTLRKYPNSSCASFATITKTGTFTISSCTTPCNNGVSLSINMD